MDDDDDDTDLVTLYILACVQCYDEVVITRRYTQD